MVQKKKSEPKKSEQLNSIDPKLIKEFSEYDNVEEVPVVNRASGLRPDPLPLYLKGVLTSSGANCYDLTLNIIRQIYNGLVFSEAVESFGEDTQEIIRLAREHRGIAKAVNYTAANQMSFWIEKIKEASYRDWKAAAFYLERRYTYNFSELKGIPRDDSMPIKVIASSDTQGTSPSELSDEELVKAVASRKK